MTLRLRTSDLSFLLAASLALLAGCKKAEQKDCVQALFDGRSAARRDDLEEARRKLAGAREHCTERQQAHADQLEQEIRVKQAKLEHLAEVEALENAAAREVPARALVEWVAHERAAADRGQGESHCFARGEEGFGWCESQRDAPAGATFSVRYYKTEPQAFRYRAELSMPVVCDDLDAHRVVRKWRLPGDPPVERVHCEFLSKKLRDLSGLITTSGSESTVDIFSTEYLERDPAFRVIVEREGR